MKKEGGKQTHLSPSISSKSNLGRRTRPWEVWDCQLGNLTAGKVSGGGGGTDKAKILRKRLKPVTTSRYVVPTVRVTSSAGRGYLVAVKARFGSKDSLKKMRKSMQKQEFSEFMVGAQMSYPDQSQSNHFYYCFIKSCCYYNVIEMFSISFVAESLSITVYHVMKMFRQIGKLDFKMKIDIQWEKGNALSEDDAAVVLLVNATGEIADDVQMLLLIFHYGYALLRLGDTFGSDKVFDLSAPSIFDTTPKDVAEKPLYDRFVKVVGMHAVPPPITGTFMPPSNKPDLDDTQLTRFLNTETTHTKVALHPVFQVLSPQAPRPMNSYPLPLQIFPPFEQIMHLCPAGSRNRPTSGSCSKEDWELLLSPQQFCSWRISRPKYSMGSRPMWKLINLHGLTLNDHNAGQIVVVSRSMTAIKKLDDFVKIAEFTSHRPFICPTTSEALIISTTHWRLQMTLAGLLGKAIRHLIQADLAWPSRNRVPAGKIDSAAGGSDGPTKSSTPVFTPNLYPSPSDLANSMSSSLEMEDIYHHPDTGIFSSSSYDDDFGGTVTNLTPSIVAQGHRQEEGIDYDEVFAPVARIEAIRIFLAFASYMGFMVYQMDVKSAFLYGEIDEEVYVTQPKGFEDPFYPKHVYRVVKALYGLHQAPRACQDKYVQDMLKKFDMESVRPATTPFEASKPKSKDEPDDAVNVHLYRSMIGSLMYLTASRPDIQFAVSACSRHQVTPLTSNLNAVKKIFKYLKGQPKLGLWYPRDSPFVLEAYSDSDYAGSHGDRKSTTGGCQFLGRRLISWQCKKQTIVATSSTEAEYVAAANCCGQFLLVALLVPTGRTIPTGLEGPPAILATIDRTPYTITESLVRSQLQLDDEGGVEDLPIADIYLGMDNLGYPSEGKLTFFKNKFSPQWRFLVHTIMHCLSTKSGSWDQFGSQLAIAIICLTEGRRYNWSSYIFKGMVNNINNPKKFLMFPSKMFANMRLNFQGDHMPLLGTMLPPAQAAIAGESSGEAAPSNPQTVPKTITEPDHSHDHESTPPKPTTSNFGAPVNELGPSSDPNIASSSRPHESAPDQFTSTNVEDETTGGSFQTLPPRSTQAPPEGTTSGGAEDLEKLTALSTLVSTLVQKVNTQESELNAHKLLFKEVVGKLVKKVKLLEDKLKGRKRKFVMTDSDKEEDAEQDVDPLIKLAKAAATAVATSAVPTGGSHDADIPPSSYITSDEFAGGSDVPAGATTGPSADPSKKGKSPLLEEDPPVRERTFRQQEEDRLGEEAARRMYEEEQAELEREREEMLRKRQQDVLNSAKYYTNSDWTDIMGQVHANQGLTADLLGPDVNEDNFAERMVALIAKRRREFAAQRFQDKRNKLMTYAQQKAYMRTFVKNQSSTIYTTGWTMKHVKSFSDDQLKTEFDKIRAAVAELKSLNIKRSLKRPGADLEQASSKKSKPTEAPQSSVPDESQQPSVEVPSQKATKEDVEVPSNTASTAQHTDGDPEAEHKMCIKYASDVDSAFDDDTPVNLHAIGDLKVLIDSPEVNDGSDVWKNQHTWIIQSWKLYSYPGIHVLETVSRLVIHMFVDKKYPLSVSLIERMLNHQLEICHDTVGNELTTAVQLIAFLKKQISDLRRPKVHDCPCLDADFLVADSKFMNVAFGVGFKMLLFNPLMLSTKDLSRNLKYVVPTGRVNVPAGRYVVPTGKDKIIVSAGRTKVIPASSTILVLVSLVNASLKKLKFHLTQFDSVVKKRTTPNALEEGEWWFEHTKTVFNNEIIPFLKSLKDIFNVFDKDLLNEITEVQTVFDQMEVVVQQYSVDKQCLEIAKKEILLENGRLLQKIMSQNVMVFKDQFDSIKQTRVRHKEQSDSLINKLNLNSMENEDLKAQIQDKVFVITSLKNDLRKLKRKEIVEHVVHTPSATTIAPGMFKLDLVPLPPRLLQNRDAHVDYLRYTQEQANTLREIVEQAKVKQPLDSELDFAFKKVRFAEPLTSSNNIKQVESSNTSDSNIPVLSSTGVNYSTSNCGSKPPGNKKNDRISQTPSRNKKNKIKAQPRKVNKTNSVVKPICDVDLKHSQSNANSEILCATCNKSMFYGIHDKCLLDLVQNKNNRTKSAKKHKKQNIWKPTGHVFTEVGFKWKPTGKTFTTVGCPDCTLGTTRLQELWGMVTISWEMLLSQGYTTLKGLDIICFLLANFGVADLEVAFQKNTCFTRNLEGVDLLSGSREINLYTISLDYMLKSSLIYLLSKASKTKSWFWHRRLSHLNFVGLNKLAKDGLARGFPRLKFQKDHLCSASEAINTACYTQNRSLIRLRYNKTPYELMQDKKPDLSFLYVFGSLCYLTNDHENLGKFDAKADIGIFVGYAPAKKAFRIYNRRTQIISETIHVTFNDLTAMASEQFSSEPGLQYMTPATSCTRLVSKPVS
ncbi:putative ribonuclease H-like domain-containing protein [Tanacetum coccineum]